MKRARGGGHCREHGRTDATNAEEHSYSEGGMEKRKFRYHFRLHKGGPLRYGEGATVEEAARDAGVTMAQVKRHMPVEALLTPEERERRQQRFEMLRRRQTEARASTEGDVIDTLEGEE